MRGVSFHPHLGDLRNGPSLREVMRHWGLPFIPTLARRSPCVEDTPIDANKRPGGECALGGAHEGFAGFSSNNGQLGGFDRDALMVAEQALGGNTWVDVYRAGNWSLFGAADNSIPYSPWELYAGGMMAASEVTESCGWDNAPCGIETRMAASGRILSPATPCFSRLRRMRRSRPFSTLCAVGDLT